MSDLPKYFQWKYSRCEESGLQPFHYNRERGMFVVGGAAVRLVDFDPLGYSPSRFDLSLDGVAIEDMSTHPALLQVAGGVIAGPSLHRWAATNPSKLEEVSKVMAEAFSEFAELPSEICDEPIDGISTSLRQRGGLRLQVYGNCACMEPSLSGVCSDNGQDGISDHGYADYDLHNAYIQAQRASLYAGMGHIARLTADAQY